jgi:hypothetical protein
MEALDEERVCRKHVSTAAHHAAVSTRSREADLEGVGSCPHQAGLRNHCSRLHEARHVQPDDGVRMVNVEQAFGDHRLRTFDDLLRRLKHEQVAASHVPYAIDDRARDADHDRHVRVVTARMHPPVGAREKSTPDSS